MNLEKIIISIFILLLLSTYSECFGQVEKQSGEFSKIFKITPSPQQIKVHSEKGIKAEEIRKIYIDEGRSLPVLFGKLSTLPLSINKKNGVLILQQITGVQNERPESYTVDVTGNNIIVKSGTDEGLFYGCITVNQLLEDALELDVSIPACTIKDWSDVPYRAVHLDMKHHVESIDYYYSIIDRLANIKVNAVIIEFEDKLKYRMEEIASEDAISIQQMKALSRYAKERFIEISPLVQGLGHASYILKNKRFTHLRENPNSDWAFSPLNDETYEVQFSLYEDALEATPFGKYLHIGGDEVGNLGGSKLSKESGMEPFELQMYWLEKVCNYAERNNRIPIFWDDMVFKLADLYPTTYKPEIPISEVENLWDKNANELAENIDLFPKNCVYMRWNYSTPEVLGNRKAIEWYKSKGLKVMSSTAAQTAWPMLPLNHSNFVPIREFSRITVENKLPGILCTVWDDCSPPFETVWRGLYYFAMSNWNYEPMKREAAENVFRHRFYGSTLGGTKFEFQNDLEFCIDFWAEAFLERGDRYKPVRPFHFITLPDAENGNTWNKKYRLKIEEANKIAKISKAVDEKIKLSINSATRNRYALNIMQRIHEIQKYSTNLLLLLSKFDSSPKNEKKEALLNIKNHISSFSGLRDKYEVVLSETRILEKPKNYLIDSNHHNHLANMSIDASWMYLFEIEMNQKISEWIKKTMKTL